MLARRTSSLCIAVLTTLGAACGTDPEPSDTLADTGTGESDTATTDDEASGSETATESTDTTTDTDTDTETTGSDLCEGDCNTPNCGVCPENLSVDIPDGFSIGATEVRKADYALLLDVVFEPMFFAGWLPAECEWKTDFTPTNWVLEALDSPVVLVDWCDAWAYCSWSGQHLCGQIGGGPIAEADINDPELAEWHRACTANGANIYPYGNDYALDFCNGLEAGFEQRVNVGSLKDCEGGYPGVFDLSGNVWEWENSCVPDPLLGPEAQLCQYRGGSYLSQSQNMRCLTDTPRPRNHRHVSVGFRCCDAP